MIRKVKIASLNLYGVDNVKKTIADLHDMGSSNMVKHQHVVKHRSQNIVYRYNSEIKMKLDVLCKSVTLIQVGMNWCENGGFVPTFHDVVVLESRPSVDWQPGDAK